ncbi:MAG: SDR family NAD(P)-dependent oxidoreductase [Nitrospirae bacterium]|nr:SDR family NAD(P)-dependent oxidoreductase [Nitrospirota bacterium]
MGPAQKPENKIAIVTGASGGIGRAIALAFADQCASVALLSRNRDRLENLAGEIRAKTHRESLILSADVRSPAEIRKAIEQVMDRHGRIDYLVNVAGIISYKPFLELTLDEIDAMMSVNYFGTVACVRAVLPVMLRQKTGHIVNIGSTAGRRGFPMETGYCASKFAVAGFSEALRMELHGTGVHISLLSPGIVDTPMARDFLSLPGIREEVHPLSAELIASWVLKAVEEERVEVILPFSTKMVIRLNSVAPRWADWIIRWRLKRIAGVIAKSSALR